MSSYWRGRRSALQVAGLGSLVVASLALRLRGIDFGTPLVSNYYIRPDETLVVVPAAELFARLGNPGHVNYPAAMIDVLAVVYHALHAWLAIVGAALPTLLDDVGANPSRYFLAGRIVSACCGAALALVVYRIAGRFASPLAAATGAVWYAVSPLAVREAHFAVTDTAMSLLVACAVYAGLRVVESPAPTRRRALVVCGIVAGAAVATKYTAAVVVPALVAALWWTRSGRRLLDTARDLTLFLVVAGATFAVLNLWLVTHPAPLIEWMRTLFQAVYVPRDALADAPGITHGWTRLADYAGLMPGGVLGATTAAAGMAVAARRLRGDARIVVPLLTATAFVLLFAPASTLPFRYLAPLLPLSAILSAIALDAVRQRVRPRAGGPLLLAAGLAGVVATAPAAVYLVNSLTLEDTRSQAGRWIQAQVPPSVPVVWLGMPESEPQLQESRDSIQRRIAYVERTYGPVAARVIDRMYVLAMRAPAASGPDAYEVFRNPRPEDVGQSVICVVQAAFPSPTVVTDTEVFAEWTRGRVLHTERIGRPLPPGRHLLEPWDAFFLPINLDRPVQPGPELVISLVERDR